MKVTERVIVKNREYRLRRKCLDEIARDKSGAFELSVTDSGLDSDAFFMAEKEGVNIRPAKKGGLIELRTTEDMIACVLEIKQKMIDFLKGEGWKFLPDRIVPEPGSNTETAEPQSDTIRHRRGMAFAVLLLAHTIEKNLEFNAVDADLAIDMFDLGREFEIWQALELDPYVATSHKLDPKRGPADPESDRAKFKKRFVEKVAEVEKELYTKKVPHRNVRPSAIKSAIAYFKEKEKRQRLSERQASRWLDEADKNATE